jgi:hypothetical protein
LRSVRFRFALHSQTRGRTLGDSVSESDHLARTVLIRFAGNCVPSGQSQNRYLHSGEKKLPREARIFRDQGNLALKPDWRNCPNNCY